MPQIPVNTDAIDDVEVNTGGSSAQYAEVPSGRYFAVVEDVRHGYFESRSGTLYYLQPRIRLINDNNTIISKDRPPIGYYDPETDQFVGKDGKPALWLPAIYMMSSFGYRTESKVTVQDQNDFFTALATRLPDNQDPEGLSPEGAISGLLLQVNVIQLPYSFENEHGETISGSRNAVGYKLRDGGNGRQYPQGGWMIAKPEELEAAGIEYVIDYHDPNSNLIFQTEEDLTRYYEVLADGPAVPEDIVDTDNPFA